jgi:hypothetical protein
MAVSEPKLKEEKVIKQFLTVLFFATVYAVMRYAGFANVSPIHIPVYLLNKGLSMTAAFSLLMASLGLVRCHKDVFDFWRKACMNLVFVHVLLSLAIFNKGYFPKWFAGDMMSLTGEVTLLLGALGVYCFWRLLTFDMKPHVRRVMMTAACALVAGHLFVMGYDGWLQVSKWNGGLPPITLLSFLLVVSSLAQFLRVSGKHEALFADSGRVLTSKIGSL